MQGLNGNGTAIDLRSMVTTTRVSDQQHQPLARLSPRRVIFVGYGVTAPEFGWDDYAGVGREGQGGALCISR